jgi:hypothetical protein
VYKDDSHENRSLHQLTNPPQSYAPFLVAEERDFEDPVDKVVCVLPWMRRYVMVVTGCEALASVIREVENDFCFFVQRGRVEPHAHELH